MPDGQKQLVEDHQQEPVRETNALAVLALLIGIAGISIIAIILAHFALKQINRTQEKGRWMALAGATLGFIWMGVGLTIAISSAATP